MQRLEVSGAVRPIYGSLGVKRLMTLRQWETGSRRFIKTYCPHLGCVLGPRKIVEDY